MAQVTHKLVFAPLYPEGANHIVPLSLQGSPHDLDVAGIAEREIDPATHDPTCWCIIAPSDSKPDTYWYQIRTWAD